MKFETTGECVCCSETKQGRRHGKVKFLCVRCGDRYESEHVGQKRPKCLHPRCRNRAAPNRVLCFKHVKKRWAVKNPEKNAFNILRTNARRRKKPFTLTLEQFTDFLKKTGYLEKKGCTKGKFSIDRIRNAEGYTVDNIRLVTVEVNSAKGAKDEDENCPF